MVQVGPIFPLVQTIQNHALVCDPHERWHHQYNVQYGKVNTAEKYYWFSPNDQLRN